MVRIPNAPPLWIGVDRRPFVEISQEVRLGALSPSENVRFGYIESVSKTGGPDLSQ